MDIQTPGVVLRRVDYKETDCILTVLTAEGGVRTVKAQGCRRKNSPLAAASQSFVYSQMELFEYRDYFTLKEANILNQFWGVREDVVKLSLASYFAEVAQSVGVEGEGNPELMSLLLNSFYALDKLGKPNELIRTGFDLKCMALAGYAPLLDGCAVCGAAEPVEPMLNLAEGVLHCRRCSDEVGPGSARLTAGMLEAIRHVIYGNPKRIFSFTLPPEELARLAKLASGYLTTQLERGFKTLDFYLSIKE